MQCHPMLLIACGMLIIVACGCLGGNPSQPTIPVPTTATTTIVTTTTPVPATITPTPTPEPFPNALRIKQMFPFGTGRVASEGNVYRYWLNDTYQWHNDKDNHYYTREPRRGYKFLIIFVNMVNRGDTRVWLPSRDSIRVMYAGIIYNTDPEHPMPDLTSRIKETPIEVGEIQYFHKFYGTEYVEDFGYSHGMPLDYLYPGESNAIDGYLLYEVPASLTPEMTYVEIAFNGKDVGVWTLS